MMKRINDIRRRGFLRSQVASISVEWIVLAGAMAGVGLAVIGG